ncbi:hypothetical protein HYV57_04170 [Candidatus Peregrinibacteria bacterium]|nr:hypothetical protein [Candidatus Peregrinibacteria bacterium]
MSDSFHHDKTCFQCQQNFEISAADISFYEKVSPHFSGQNFLFPPPSLCPDCRQQRRLAWRNERTLYRRKCGATERDIISVYSPDKPFPVYNNDFWFSDQWDAKKYGRDFDFKRPFFEQFEELMNAVPQLARSATGNENCEYVNQCGWCKDCYLIFEADFNRDCMYSNNIYDSRDSMDILQGYNLELCYECIDCMACYNLHFSQDCKHCSDSWFLKNCISCSSCFGCSNLRNKQFYFFNKPYTKEEYDAKLSEVNFCSFSEMQNMEQKFRAFSIHFPQKSLHGIQNEDSTGDYLSHTQRCRDCYDLIHGQDCKFVFNARNTKMVYDMTVFGSQKGAEFCYENHEIGFAVRNVCFSDQIWDGCYDIFYSKLCIQNCHHLFGCVGLKRSQYCIFNKQYSKDDYESLVPRIIEHMKKTRVANLLPPQSAEQKDNQSSSQHNSFQQTSYQQASSQHKAEISEWGEFLPASLSPYGYNETVAQVYFPLTKEMALKKGYKWKDIDMRDYQIRTTIIPDTLDEISDLITQKILACATCKKNYKIIPQELAFYRKKMLPIPRLCHDCRHAARMSLRNPRKLWKRVCGTCGITIETTYAPDRPEIVYCENCYLQSVY